MALPRLVAGRGHGHGRVAAQADPGAGGRGRALAVVVDGHDGIQRRAAMEGLDRVRRCLGPAQ